MTKCISLCLLLLTASVKAQNAEVAKPPDFAVLSYDQASTAVNAEVASIVVQHIRKPGPEYLSTLDMQLQYGHLNNDNKILAIYLLGELRPSDLDSINILIDTIDLKAEKFDRILKTGISIVRWGDYPAEEALMKIHKPAVSPIVNHLPTEGNELRRHLLCEALRRIEGKAAALADIQQKLPAVQTNLQSALKEVEH